MLLNRGNGSFQAKRDFRTGRGPNSVAIGDLNGDGNPDLATAGFAQDSVSVLLNRGDGSFQAWLDYATGDTPSSVAIGDLNGDEKPDLAITNRAADTVSVLLNRGDGSFEATLDYTTGDGPYSVAIGDLNGDDKPDLAIANNHYKTVSVLVNRGDASFQAKHDYRAGDAPNSVAIGDLNGDEKPDLAIANGAASSVSVLLNRGDGSFQAKHDFRTGHGPNSVAIGDLNGDRRPDLAIAYFLLPDANFYPDAGIVSVLANRGDGSFQARLDYRNRNGRRREQGSSWSVAIGDLNSDRKPDLATANYLEDGAVAVFLNTPGLCTVQDVRGQTLSAAKRTIARANCRVGKIRRAYARYIKRGRVISEKPKPGTVLPNRGKVTLVVSLGRRPS